MLVSVIIPVYNGAQFIDAALASVAAQQYAPLEVIVIDDGSTDATAAIVKRSGIMTHYHYQPNQGAQHARNQGLKLASGDLIAFLDSDDAWAHNKLQTQTQLIGRNDMIIGHTQLFPHDSEPFFMLSLVAGLFKKECFERVGCFDSTLAITDDLDWLFRARELGLKLKTHEDVVLHHRRHDTNITKQQSQRNQHEMLRILQMSLQRRRATGQIDQPSFDQLEAKA